MRSLPLRPIAISCPIITAVLGAETPKIRTEKRRRVTDAYWTIFEWRFSILPLTREPAESARGQHAKLQDTVQTRSRIATKLAAAACCYFRAVL